MASLSDSPELVDRTDVCMEVTIDTVHKSERRRLFLPSVTVQHTVADIIQSLELSRSSEFDTESKLPITEKFFFIFKWKQSERKLPPNEHPLLLSASFKQEDVQFIVRIQRTQNAKELHVCKRKSCDKTKATISCTNMKRRSSGSHYHIRTTKNTSNHSNSCDNYYESGITFEPGGSSQNSNSRIPSKFSKAMEALAKVKIGKSPNTSGLNQSKHSQRTTNSNHSSSKTNQTF